MGKLEVWCLLERLKRQFEIYGLARLRLIRGVARHVKQMWFREFDEQSREGVCVPLDGLNVYLPPRFLAHYVMDKYEPITKRMFLDFVRKGDVVVDVGAHIGYYSLLAARAVGGAGKVHAVEPFQESVALLQKSIEANEFSNITVHCCAAGNSDSLREFQITGSSDSHGFFRHPNTKTVETVQVIQRKLDSIVVGRVDIVKIDVEGAEIDVLEGMQEILLRNWDLVVWAEWFPAGMKNGGRNPCDLPDFLRSLNFLELSVVDEKAKTVRPVAEIIPLIKSGALPETWYANILARRNSAARLAGK